MEEAARVFAQRGLGRVTWTIQPLSGFESALNGEAADAYDLVIFDHPFCGTIAAENLFQPLDGQVNLPDDTSFLGASMRSYRYDGRVWGLPVDAACQVALYRPDLLDGPPPTTWAEVLTLACESHRRGQKIGLAALNPHGFLVLAGFCANLGGAMPEGSPGDRPFAQDILNQAIACLDELFALCDPAGLGWNAIDLHEAMGARDDLVYCPATFSYLTYGETDMRRPLGFADFVGPNGPGVGAVLGGTGLGITRSCRDPDMARAFLTMLARPDDHTDLIAHHHGQPAMTVAWQDAKADLAVGGALSATRNSMENASLRPRFNGFIPFQHKAGHETEQFLKGEISATVLADLIEAAWRAATFLTAERAERAP